MTFKRVTNGSIREYLRLFHYIFLDYSPQIAAEIVNKHNIELNYRNDKAFIDGIYRLCRDMLKYSPKLNRDQFFHTGFAQAKAEMASDIIEKIKSIQPSPSTQSSLFSTIISTSSASFAVAAASTSTSSAASNSSSISAKNNNSGAEVNGGVEATKSARYLSPPKASYSRSLARQPSTKVSLSHFLHLVLFNRWYLISWEIFDEEWVYYFEKGAEIKKRHKFLTFLRATKKGRLTQKIKNFGQIFPIF